MKSPLIPLALAALLLNGTLHAQAPRLINYQGRVAVDAVNFEGTGLFKFALVDAAVNQNVTATATPVIGGLGDVLSIDVVAGGSGYLDPPTVTISDAIGTGAEATATVEGGVVTAITVTANGLDYSVETTVTISPPPPNLAPTVTYWSNDGTSVAGSEPAAAVSLPVSKGLYSVLLGDIALTNMTAIPASAFTNPDVRLRVWFDDGVNLSQLFTPDQRLAPAVYLADGSVTSATLEDGSVVAAKIAPGTIDGTRVAAGTLDASHLTVPAAPGAGQVLGFDGAGLNWTEPAFGGDIWSTNGTTAYYNGGLVGIGTPNPAHALALGGPLPAWTSNNWGGAIELANGSAIAWRANAGGARFGIGHTNGGFGFWRTASDPGTTASPSLYDMFINDAACVCIGTLSPNPGYLLAVHGGAQFVAGGSGGTVQFGSPNGESGMSITGTARGDVRFNGTTMKLYAGPGPGPPGLGSGVAVNTSGNVGIGTESPLAKLHVVGTTRTSILTITGGADIAEPFPMKEEHLEKGSVVVIDEAHPGRLKRSTSAYDTRVAGIVSGANGINAGISLQQEGVMDGGQNVALSGRVYVQADASTGAIKPGDMLTTSDTPGHAMKVGDPGRSQGAVIGKAMGSLENGTGLVLVLVTLQ